MLENHMENKISEILKRMQTEEITVDQAKIEINNLSNIEIIDKIKENHLRGIEALKNFIEAVK